MTERDDFDTATSWQRCDDLIEDAMDDYHFDPHNKQFRMKLRRRLHRKGASELLDLDKGYQQVLKKHGRTQTLSNAKAEGSDKKQRQ